jgi:hypothetical protein
MEIALCARCYRVRRRGATRQPDEGCPEMSGRSVNRRARYRHCVYRIPTVRLRLSPVDHTRAAMG